MYVDGPEGAKAAKRCGDGECPINKKLRKVGKPMHGVKREWELCRLARSAGLLHNHTAATMFPEFNFGLGGPSLAVGS